MPPTADNLAVSHLLGVSDTARARELYKYYQPDSNPVAPNTELHTQQDSSLTLSDDLALNENLNIRSNVASSKRSSPDTALTAFAQLVSWRTGCQRAMISVIDAETQYFIAESTRTLDLVDNDRHAPGDDLWIGCSTVSKSGRLCERTIQIPPAPAGEYPAFIVNDLRMDSRFNQLPFVTGPPFLKFYAGTPLVTKRGIPIGSLFVVDDRVKNGLSKDEQHFMGTMAETIMRHMEIVREVEEHRRGTKMSRGLASFVEGRAELVEDELDAGDEEGAIVAGQFETETLPLKSRPGSKRVSRANSLAESVKSLERKEKEYSSALLQTEQAIMNSDDKNQPSDRPSTNDSQHPSYNSVGLSTASTPADGFPQLADSPGSNDVSETSTMKLLFSRAANLIREAFEVDGGSVFYDAQKGFSSEFSQDVADNAPAGEAGTGEDWHIPPTTMTKDFAASGDAPPAPPLRSMTFQRTSIASEKNVEILGFSTPSASSIHGDEPPGNSVFTPPDESALHGLLRRYPRGKLWTFDGDGSVSSSEEENKAAAMSKKTGSGGLSLNRMKKHARSVAEAALLLRHFPGVRQLLFVPLWDASRSRWLSGNFTWSNEPTRILSKQQELAFLTAFGNSVMAECNRLDTEVADQKKSDFIGSISHELRSPLHGILASAEFLSDEVAEGFTKGLVETIDSCGRTLLDTINHILDFSKINHFEKNWRRSRRGGTAFSRGAPRDLSLRQADLPMINLSAAIDVSVVCEEVVEGVFAGHVFQNVTAPSFDLVAEPRGKMSDTRKHQSSSDQDSLNDFKSSETEVIIDIDHENYQFTTQPGAFRRVIMNLLGNALKYTSKGYVRVKLDVSDMEDLNAGTKEAVSRSCINLTVIDTGRGISAEFLRSKLFTAFAQENALSSGTGLGLSIVRSIVSLLEGEIQVRSKPGQGTEVKVTLPLLRELPRGTESSGSTPKSIVSVPRESEELIEQLRLKTKDKTVSMYGFDDKTEDQMAYQTNQLLKASIHNFLANWYKLKVVPFEEKSDIVIANEADSATIAKMTHARRGERAPALLVLCSHSTRFNRAHAIKEGPNVGVLAKPIGPLKLARALGQCLDGVPITTTPGLDKSSDDTLDLSDEFKDLSLSPGGRGDVLDNSRMAADSENARKAIESPTPNAVVDKRREFPFPSDKGSSIDSTINSTNKTLSASSDLPRRDDDVTPRPPTQNPNVPHIAQSPTNSVLPSPRLLLVDDNKINLNLLRMYMTRSKYTHVKEAENGQEAVDAVRDSDGFDIIFMDISMPVLDGFGATRQIRQIEQKRREEAHAEGRQLPTPALIIALTGLASSRDQSEASASGVDLFLTKPVALKDVGKLLDNWKANREKDALIGSGLSDEERPTVWAIPQNNVSK